LTTKTGVVFILHPNWNVSIDSHLLIHKLQTSFLNKDNLCISTILTSSIVYYLTKNNNILLFLAWHLCHKLAHYTMFFWNKFKGSFRINNLFGFYNVKNNKSIVIVFHDGYVHCPIEWLGGFLPNLDLA